jgi:hypothetical protein
MERHAIERWTDATAFGVALGLAGAMVVPVLALGVLVTVIGGSFLIQERASIELEQAVFGLVSVGGLLGFIGYVRAHRGAKSPACHNVTATLLFLSAGVATALAVAGAVVIGTLYGIRSAGSLGWVWATTAFASANVVWVFAGIASMQRLMRRYAEKTGRAFDGLPLVLLFVVISLVVAAALMTASLSAVS